MRCLPAILLLLTASMATASPGAPRVPTAAVFSADGALIMAQEHRSVRIWRRADGKLLHTLEADPMFRGAVTQGVVALVGDKGPEVRRGDGLKTRVLLKAPRVISYGRAAVSGDGSLAAVPYRADGGAGDNDTVGLFDSRTGAMLARLGLGKRARVLGVVLGQAGRLVLLFGDGPGRGALVRLYGLVGKRRVARRRLNWSSKRHKTTYSAALSQDGRAMALGAGQELLLWTLGGKIAGPRKTSTAAIKALFPPLLRGPGVQLPGAHQLTFAPDGARLATLHAFGVVGVATWDVKSMKPTAWNARPSSGGTMRGAAWGEKGGLWLITAGYGPLVTLHAPRGNGFGPVRVLVDLDPLHAP